MYYWTREIKEIEHLFVSLLCLKGDRGRHWNYYATESNIVIRMILEHWQN